MIINFLIIFFLLFSTILTTNASDETKSASYLENRSWNEIVEIAKGGEVNWFLWGGSDHVNRYVNEYIALTLDKQYGITLNMVPLTDTVIAVNTVLSEKESGINNDGSVDIIWINSSDLLLKKKICKPNI